MSGLIWRATLTQQFSPPLEAGEDEGEGEGEGEWGASIEKLERNKKKKRKSQILFFWARGENLQRLLCMWKDQRKTVLIVWEIREFYDKKVIQQLQQSMVVGGW
jgi:hypothetical protein